MDCINCSHSVIYVCVLTPILCFSSYIFICFLSIVSQLCFYLSSVQSIASNNFCRTGFVDRNYFYLVYNINIFLCPSTNLILVYYFSYCVLDFCLQEFYVFHYLLFFDSFVYMQHIFVILLPLPFIVIFLFQLNFFPTSIPSFFMSFFVFVTMFIILA